MRAVIFLLFISLGLQAQSPVDIIRQAEEKMRGKSSAYMEMSIEVVRPKWSRSMSLKSWSKGEDYSLSLLTAPAKDKGIAFLKRGKEVWNWMPSIERSIKMPPSMMMQSWMGTDLSNDDLVRESSAVTDYTHFLEKDTLLDGHKCWKIILTPKEDAPVVWGKVIAFIEQTHYVQIRTEQYDEDAYLINVLEASEIKNMDGVMMATHLALLPVENEGQMTVMKIEKVLFNQPYDDAFFTVKNMKKIQ
jgi:outer membrane lipoprotein-sorting protein